jgi:hypothetical protein
MLLLSVAAGFLSAVANSIASGNPTISTFSENSIRFRSARIVSAIGGGFYLTGMVEPSFGYIAVGSARVSVAVYDIEGNLIAEKTDKINGYELLKWHLRPNPRASFVVFFPFEPSQIANVTVKAGLGGQRSPRVGFSCFCFNDMFASAGGQLLGADHETTEASTSHTTSNKPWRSQNSGQHSLAKSHCLASDWQAARCDVNDGSKTALIPHRYCIYANSQPFVPPAGFTQISYTSCPNLSENHRCHRWPANCLALSSLGLRVVAGWA